MKISDTQLAYADQQFEKLEKSKHLFKSYEFENCQFTQCDFSEATFNHCKFIDCEFIRCNLGLLKPAYSSFINTVFEECKAIGINWSEASLPQFTMPSPIYFYRCDVSHSSFFQLKLPELILEDCKAHGVDFREADLSKSNLAYSDFNGCQFVRTNLTQADFTEAINYVIDVELNIIKQATFSFPEVVNLLRSLDINIIGQEDND